MKRKINRKTVMLIVILTLLVAIPTIITLHQIKIVQMQQTDTLNQVMELRQEITPLTSVQTDEISTVEKLIASDKKTLTSENKELIQRVVASEARGDTLDGIIAVAQTIKDRGDLWNMDYADVVLQDGQYAAPYNGEISEKVIVAVDLVFEDGFSISDEPITHFHSLGVDNEPYWTEGKVNRGNLGSRGHLFYY